MIRDSTNRPVSMDCFLFKQKTAYEMRISDWSSDVCSSDLETDDKNDPETPKEPETGTQGVATSETRAFNHVIKVLKPCPYLHQADWHVANGKMAYNLAIKAGHVPTGEAKHIQTQDAADPHQIGRSHV